ncbi:protein FAM210A-like [Asterias rubens]|uniref:protein FAM210A-like n=1 Tax=Asterias rubens TaxID=7604 RepID=UPI0014558083|nr:protein FAM210A-like [Asterias rubens]
MAMFRSYCKLQRAVVPELKILKDSCSAVKGSPLQRVFQSSQNIHHFAPITSAHQHLRLKARTPCTTLPNSSSILVCSGLSLDFSHSCFHSSGHPRNNSTSTKTEKRDGEEDVQRTSPSNEDKASDGTERPKSQIVEEEDDDEPIVALYDETGKPLSNWVRMKMMMKAYGYVIIPVHWLIAPVWFGAFYYTIKMGVDIGPFLLKIGVSEHHVETLNNSKASNALLAYALYKIFTPLRYTVTVGSTEMTIRYLRRKGYIKHAPRKEKTYRESLKETVQGVKEKIRKDET